MIRTVYVKEIFRLPLSLKYKEYFDYVDLVSEYILAEVLFTLALQMSAGLLVNFGLGLLIAVTLILLTYCTTIAEYYSKPKIIVGATD